tara:strand:- start:383 stop:823 length:441 start_codon:yes stop_codon:yes gene_type:complete
MSRAFVSFVVFALLSVGCARPVDTAIVAANVAAISLNAAHAKLATAYRSEQLAAIARVQGDPHSEPVKAERRDRVASVRLRFSPIWSAYKQARSAWIILGGAIRAAKRAERTKAKPAEVELVLLIQALTRAQTRLIQSAATGGLSL